MVPPVSSTRPTLAQNGDGDWRVHSTDQADVFRKQRQTYLDALPIAAAVAIWAEGKPSVRACNGLFMGISGKNGPVDQQDFTRRLQHAGAADWPGDRFEWRESSKVDARHFLVTMSPVGTTLAGDPIVLITLVDRTNEVATTRSLRAELLTDSLTGLPNRMGFIERVEQRFTADCADSYAIAVIDLARFARVNECIGPLGGDELIITVARRLMSTIRGYDQLGRTGANEFAMVIRVADAEDVNHVVSRVQAALAQPCRLSDLEIKVDCAIGCAFAAIETDDAEQLLRFAQIAVKTAKQTGKVEFYQPATLAVARRRFSIETELRRALDQNALSMAFQPLMSFETGKIKGFEALARWTHPTFGIVSPVEFIAVAEESGLIVQLGRWALDEAMRTLAAWDAKFGAQLPVYVAVNVSPIQLVRDDVPGAIAVALRESGLTGERLSIELTESALIADPARAIRTLDALKSSHAMIAMDDFGTGFSNLATLQRLPIDTLKIDRSFISEMIDDKDKQAIIAAIQSFASALGMTTTAEGVETKEQALALKAIGCTTGQGYLYSRPLAADSAFEFALASLGLGER